MKNYYYKRKVFLNHLINCIEELQTLILINTYLYIMTGILNFENTRKSRK